MMYSYTVSYVVRTEKQKKEIPNGMSLSFDQFIRIQGFAATSCLSYRLKLPTFLHKIKYVWIEV